MENKNNIKCDHKKKCFSNGSEQFPDKVQKMYF